MKYITLTNNTISGCFHQIEKELGKSISYFIVLSEPVSLMGNHKVFTLKERNSNNYVKVEGDEFIIDSIYNDITKR